VGSDDEELNSIGDQQPDKRIQIVLKTPRTIPQTGPHAAARKQVIPAPDIDAFLARASLGA